MNTLMSSPELYPMRIDTQRHLVWFTHMSRDGYRTASFLDPTATRISSDVFTFNLDDLLLYGVHDRNHVASIRYVFHTAFCCSTLLARYLDLISPCFVLREPSILAQIAILRPRRTSRSEQSRADLSETEWRTLLDLAMRLLTRTYSQGDAVVIKVNDLCNSLGDMLLEIDVGSRMVFLFVSLRTFVLSVLKSQARRVWLRNRLGYTRRVIESIPALANIDVTRLNAAEAAALLWLQNSALYNSLRVGKHSGRVLALDGERVAERPKKALEEIASFFGLPLPEKKLDELLNHPSVSRYSKDMSIRYSAENRRAEIAGFESRYGEEADQGIAWARSIKQSLEFDAPWETSYDELISCP